MQNTGWCGVKRMPVNEWGVKLARNGYAPSILDTKPHVCFLCGRTGNQERHEIFGGARRQKSKEYGLWVNLCPECHRTSPMAVHQSKTTAVRLKSMAQKIAMDKYGWSREEWLRRFYKNYIDLEV